MHLCLSCLMSLSYKERVIKCAGKGCDNNPRKEGQIRPLFNLSHEEIQKGIDLVGSVRELVAGFIKYVPGTTIRTLVISSRRELEETILTALVCPPLDDKISKIAKVLEKKCLECLAAERVSWKTFLCRICRSYGTMDDLESVKNAFKKSFLEAGSPRVAEKVATIATVALLSMFLGEEPFRKEVIINGSNSLARLGLLGWTSSCPTTV